MRAFLPAFLAVTACAGDAPVPPREFDGAQALRYVEAQLAFGPRIPGTEGHRRMAAWLDSLLRARADTVLRQEWTHLTRAGDSLPMRNFLARFNPAAPVRLLFLAHWDTRPRADAVGSRDTTAPVPGANDGASGVAVLLAMADALDRLPPAVGVDLLFVDGEDYGDFGDPAFHDVLIGARHFAANLPPGPRPRFAILLDMVGDRDLRIPQEGNSLIGAPDLVEEVWAMAERIGHGAAFPQVAGISLSDDHLPLQQVGLRAIDIIDFDYGPGNSWWHTPDDTLDKVSAASLAIVGDVMLALVRTAKP